jgi:hypothetical protein
MVNFLPQNSTGKCAEEELDFCNSLNNTDTGFRCLNPNCSGIDTDIFVSRANPDYIFFTVGNYCCENFKTKINKFLPEKI